MALSDQAAGLDALDASGRGLRVEFFRCGDRYAHRVLAVTGDRGGVELLESIEGADDQDWPDSPALQALNFDQLREQGEPAALIGMSGSSHWSLSVERRLEHGTIGLLFDAACRVRTGSSRVASSYRIAADVQDCRDEPSKLHLQTTAGPIVIHVLATEGGAIEPPLLQLDGDRLTVVREPEPDSTQTLRWRYAIELAPSF